MYSISMSQRYVSKTLITYYLNGILKCIPKKINDQTCIDLNENLIKYV